MTIYTVAVCPGGTCALVGKSQDGEVFIILDIFLNKTHYAFITKSLHCALMM